jgi:hypothetical protein
MNQGAGDRDARFFKVSTAVDASRLQAQLLSNISRSISLFKSVELPKKTKALTKAVLN